MKLETTYLRPQSLTLTMSDTSCNIELDITEAHQYYPLATHSSSSSSRLPLISQQPVNHGTPDPSETVTNIDHMPSCIDVTTVSNLEVNILWVDTISGKIKIGSWVRIKGRQELYMVMGVVRRSAKGLTVICIAKNGHAVGLVVQSGHLEQTWSEVFRRYLLVTFCSCFLL